MACSASLSSSLFSLPTYVGNSANGNLKPDPVNPSKDRPCACLEIQRSFCHVNSLTDICTGFLYAGRIVLGPIHMAHIKKLTIARSGTFYTIEFLSADPIFAEDLRVAVFKITDPAFQPFLRPMMLHKDTPPGFQPTELLYINGNSVIIQPTCVNAFPSELQLGALTIAGPLLKNETFAPAYIERDHEVYLAGILVPGSNIIKPLPFEYLDTLVSMDDPKYVDKEPFSYALHKKTTALFEKVKKKILQATPQKKAAYANRWTLHLKRLQVEFPAKQEEIHALIQTLL